MMSNQNGVRTNELHTVECKCLSWKPIFAGALIIIGFSFLLNLFSVAIGLTAYTTDSSGVENLALGGLLASCIAILVSMFAAGWLTGYLGQRHCNKAHLGALYGFLAWCLALIISVFLFEHVHQYLSFYTHSISGTADAWQMNPVAAAAAADTGNAHTNSVVISTYVLFSLFFLSAFACSFGSHCGMRHVCKNSNC